MWVWDVGVANQTNWYCGPHQDFGLGRKKAPWVTRDEITNKIMLELRDVYVCVRSPILRAAACQDASPPKTWYLASRCPGPGARGPAPRPGAPPLFRTRTGAIEFWISRVPASMSVSDAEFNSPASVAYSGHRTSKFWISGSRPHQSDVLSLSGERRTGSWDLLARPGLGRAGPGLISGPKVYAAKMVATTIGIERRTRPPLG